MLTENNQYYTIIVAEPGTEAYDTEEDYKYGRILLLRSDPLMVRWWETKQAKLRKNIEAIEVTGDKGNNTSAKLAALRAEVKTYTDLIQKHANK